MARSQNCVSGGGGKSWSSAQVDCRRCEGGGALKKRSGEGAMPLSRLFSTFFLGMVHFACNFMRNVRSQLAQGCYAVAAGES